VRNSCLPLSQVPWRHDSGRIFRACISSLAHWVIGAAIALGAFPSVASANETDQFLLPSDHPFADVGRYVSGAHYIVLERVTQKINAKIRQAQLISDPEKRAARIEALHAPRKLADMVREEFGPGFFETIGVENSLRSKLARSTYPDHAYTAFKRWDWVYAFGTLPIDPRIIPMSLPSSTICVYGHYIGTDKLGHFHDLGHYYFCDYTTKRKAGKSEDQAIAEVVATYSRGVLSETTTIGFLATGVCSNADLASNYMGLKFYRNLTEPVMLQGTQHPPMLVLVGDYWQLNLHVRPESDFFEPFVSDHWNEALNPCVYELGLGWVVERRLKSDADEVLSFYCDIDGRPRDPAYFANLAIELSTYYGENYGYYGDPAKVMSIATTCLAVPDKTDPQTFAPEPSPPPADSTQHGD